MDGGSLIVTRESTAWTATIHRPERRNSIDGSLLVEINRLLDDAERDPRCRAVVLQGSGGIFCTGMDFAEAVAPRAGETLAELSTEQKQSLYIDTLRRMTLSSVIVVSHVDGVVMAGGMGFVAASDFVFATHRSTFGLSEALWGLMPANVAPYLIRRVGFRKAYVMTLTTRNFSAEEAAAMDLVDEVVERPMDAIRRLMLRLDKVASDTVADIKEYFRSMWIITDAMEQQAVRKLVSLMSNERTIRNIRAFVDSGTFPWEHRDELREDGHRAWSK